MNGARLPVIVSIDFNSGPDLTKRLVVVLAVVRQEGTDDALVQQLCCHQEAVDFSLR
jgi:hypothetical protein